MSKELIVAGSIVAACIGLSVVAFVSPGAKPAPTEPENPVVNTEPAPIPDRWSTGTSTSGGTAADPFAFPTPMTDPTPFDRPEPPPTTTTVVEEPPALPPTPEPDAATTERTHVVARGDTLGDISRQYYGTTRHWKKIQDANKVDPNGLLVGQKLTIPVVASEPSSTTPSGADTSASAGLYEVKRGDSYYRIAERELGDPSRARDIERLNGIAPEDLRVGQKLKLPTRAATASPAPTTAGTTTAPPAGSRQHTVQKDEYLVDISEKYYGTTTRWKLIADANPGVNPNRLLVGQKLVIPDAGGSSGGSSAGSSGSTASVAAGDSYVIKSGDTLERIAQRTLGDGGKWRDIAKLNPGLDPTRLMVGQKITLPQGAQQAAPAPAPTPAPTPAPSNSRDTAPTFRTPTPAPTFPTPAPSPSFPAPSSDTPFPAPAPVTDDPWNLPPAPAPSNPQPAPAMDDPWADFPGSTR